MLELSGDGVLPPGRHRCQVDDFFNLFVKAFSTNAHRQRLFREWESYNDRLCARVGLTGLTQWIDGSFVTNKPFPNDIDFVTFIPHYLYEPFEDGLIEFYSTISLHDNGLDAYICPIYPAEHPSYQLTRQYRAAWQKRFKKNKDTSGEKGFLELIL
ncbi:hypothetical protein EXU85_29420 [Spirosoma sp. KCTC 42546]|uniref:DUF6932 family protein n=1 Tax=Spirosoma sp. KCTC 42546 TaxID=2520506 RepID=UPI00115ACFB3|nr:hypothetical protein [Spirosoma sp. KCTC 42546]QDK82506.1 hypothetical protein EXU85_29420 [Spirosoma sp. KCTC 42546]